MKGLIVLPSWGNDILDGFKSWEIRNGNIKHRGETGIIFSGTKSVHGIVDLIDSFPLTQMLFDQNMDKHRIQNGAFDISRYKYPYVWVIDSPRRYENPIPYKHPKGAVVWVNL